MRDFNEADQKKKGARIRIKENPANLSQEQIQYLEEVVKSSLKDGYLPCPVAWEIAKKAGVPKIAVGEIADRLHIRVTDCQLGCFKVDKTPYDKSSRVIKNDADVPTKLKALKNKNALDCAGVFKLARQMKQKPIVVADVANAHNLKFDSCQLGCF